MKHFESDFTARAGLRLLLIIFLNIAFSIFIIISTDIISEYLHINLGLQLLTIVSVITSLLSNLNLTLYVFMTSLSMHIEFDVLSLGMTFIKYTL